MKRTEFESLTYAVKVILRMGLDLTALARTPMERLGVILFSIAYCLTTFLPRRLFPRDVSIMVGGVRQVVSLGGGELYSMIEIYKYSVYDALKSFVPRPGWTVVDIGANVGAYTIQSARRGARVLAFEPHPDSFRRLTSTISLNGLSESIIPFNIAIGSKQTQGILNVTRLSATVTVVPLSRGESSNTPTVAISTLDDVMKRHDYPLIDLLKIDTEGSEVDVIRGGTTTLGKVKRIILEYHSHELYHAVLAELSPRGFDVIFARRTFGDGGVLYLEPHNHLNMASTTH